jgi:D-tyrosyl-tRNA(Tyr) deacylase
VRTGGELRAEIGPGLLVLLGVAHEDTERSAERLAAKVRALRIFPDEHGNMNEALGGREILCVSQFTLYGDARRGNRPSFVAAAPPQQARPLYERFCEAAEAGGATRVARGCFGAHMLVEMAGDGPVTIMLEA